MRAKPGSLSTLTLICLTCGGWAFSFGLGSQVVSHWLANLGYSNAVIGVNHSAYYLGLALAALFVPWFMRRGAAACTMTGMILSGLTLALFPWGGGPIGYFLCRLLNGVAGAMSLIPLETLVSRGSAPEDRTRDFSFYGVALSLGGALGICVGLHGCQPGEAQAFYWGGILPVLGGLALGRWLPAARPETAEEVVPPLNLRRNFLSFGTAWSQGFLEGGMLAFMSLYLLSLGLSAEGAGNWMGLAMVGVILFQVPVGWLADRLGRVPILLGCYGVAGMCLLLVPFLGPTAILAVVLFLFGACAGAMYPLGMALLGERVPEASLPRAYAWYMAMECIGSQLGAAAMGAARDLCGQAAMFPLGLAALAVVVALWAVLQARVKPPASLGLPVNDAATPPGVGLHHSAKRLSA